MQARVVESRIALAFRPGTRLSQGQAGAVGLAAPVGVYFAFLPVLVLLGLSSSALSS